MAKKGKWQDSGGIESITDLIENLEWAIEHEHLLPEDVYDENKSYRLTLTFEWEEEVE